MATAKHKHNHSNYDLYGDLAKIRSALNHVTDDIKGKAGEVFFQSVEGVKEKSLATKDTIAEYTADNPFKCLGAALLLGLSIGYFMHK